MKNKIYSFMLNVFPYIVGTILGMIVLWFSFIKPMCTLVMLYAKYIIAFAILFGPALSVVLVDKWAYSEESDLEI